MDTKSLWYAAPGRAEVRSETLGALDEGCVRVRALHGGVSRGTEALVMAGRVPESERERMRAPFMAGDFPFPVKYGYATVGRVEKGPSGLVGRMVFALHPHQSLFDVPVDSAVPVPDGVPAPRAILAANMETALNAIWDGQPAPADRIAVVGAGVVGALVAWLCGRIPGTQVTLVDIDASRATLAQRLGVHFAVPGASHGDCDLVVHASGHASGLAAAIELAGDEATVLEMSWYGAGDVPAPLGGAFHSRRLKLVSSQVGKVSPSHRARWTHRRRLAAALSLLKEPALDALIASPVAFESLPHELPRILGAGSGILCQRIDYPAS
jgi:hypothetical protein